MSTSNEDIQEAFGVFPSATLITVPGRVLPAPTIYYRDRQSRQKKGDTAGGSWNMHALQFFRPATLRAWTWLYIDVAEARTFFTTLDSLNESLQKFTEGMRRTGLSINPIKPGMRIQLNGPNDAETIESAVRFLQKKYNLSLIITILPSRRADLYNRVKQVCDVKCGIHNVNMLAEKLVKVHEQYSANIGLKINLKLGGINQSPMLSDFELNTGGRTMIVGVDVTHPSIGSAPSAPSVAAVVASVDAELAQWPAEFRIQPPRSEMVAELDLFLQSRLRHWARCNRNALPENIVVYRDGVSEGQYKKVVEQEIPLIKSACKAVYPASRTKRGIPRLTVLVVGKRHHTRFYPVRDVDADRSANPRPGTVVDRVVSDSHHWDFYLQAHAALQGTARPAHYFTVWDEIFSPAHPAASAADELQRFTHGMCYLFGRATKSISVCPPVYYADLVCTRARCYLSELFEPMSDSTPSNKIGETEEGKCAIRGGCDVKVHPNVRDSMFYI